MALRSIVAATDLSAPARRAVDRAGMLARSSGAGLALVHAVDASALNELRRWLNVGGEVERSIVEDVRARLAAVAADLAARQAIDVEPLTPTGRAVDEIARVAEERKADLIVTGTLGAGLFRYHLIGSTAERVVKKAGRPVLMARQPAHAPYGRVLVPVDFSAWSAPSLEIGLAVAPDAHFVLVHCIEVPFESRLRLAGVDPRVIDAHRTTAEHEAHDRLVDLAARAGLRGDRYSVATPTGLNPWMAIVRLEQEQDCDLIVIGKHGRNAVEELFLGSTTNVIISEGTSDVLVSARAETA